MELVYIGLLTECIVFARDVFSSVTSKLQNEEVPISTQTAIKSDQVLLDESRLKSIIDESNLHFENLLDQYTQTIVSEIQRLRTQDAVQELQARINALKTLLNYQNISPEIASQLVITALNPLQVSLEIVKIKLSDLEDEKSGSEVWDFCRIIGMSTLIAAYGYLGQDMPSLRVELESEIRTIHRNVLDEIALMASKGEIPWDEIPYLLSVNGIEDLMNLYSNLKNRVSSDDSHETQTAPNPQGNLSSQNSRSKLQILSVNYGDKGGKFRKDITDIFQRKVLGKERLVCIVTNLLCGGDPVPGSKKMLTVNYRWSGQEFTKEAWEGDTLHLP
ncbi:MAG: hypothetical protein AAFX01_05365 [Cyanobacteria bacterium J06638_28]